MKVEDAVDKSDDSQDVSPLQATRDWVTQAENNVIDRLEEAGLVAPLTPGGFETNGAGPDRHQPGGAEQPGIFLPGPLPGSADGHGGSDHGGQHDPVEQGTDRHTARRTVDRLGGGPGTGAHRAGTPHRHALCVQRPAALPGRVDLPAHRHEPLRPDDASAAKQALVYLQASMYKDKLADAGCSGSSWQTAARS